MFYECMERTFFQKFLIEWLLYFLDYWSTDLYLLKANLFTSTKFSIWLYKIFRNDRLWIIYISYNVIHSTLKRTHIFHCSFDLKFWKISVFVKNKMGNFCTISSCCFLYFLYIIPFSIHIFKQYLTKGAHLLNLWYDVVMKFSYPLLFTLNYFIFSLLPNFGVYK